MLLGLGGVLGVLAANAVALPADRDGHRSPSRVTSSSRRHGRLDLDSVRPVPNVKKAVAGLMARAGKLSPQETDEDAMEELAADIESMVAIRGRANRELLD
jgi:hypothetical protein